MLIIILTINSKKSILFPEQGYNIYNLNFYHFPQFIVGKPEFITIWLFSKQRAHELTIVFLSFPPFPLRFVKLRYEKLFLSCNGRKTLVNSKYQLNGANLHLVFIGFQSNYSFFNVCNLETKTGFRKEMQKMRDVGFSWQRSGRSSRPRWLGLGVKEINVLFNWHSFRSLFSCLWDGGATRDNPALPCSTP